MKYFYDTEFLEGTQENFFLGFSIGETKPTIDLISIGIVAEDGREYYAISKDFNLKEAWNRFDLEINRSYPFGPEYNKVYWIRNNVLINIYRDLLLLDYADKLFIKSNTSEFERLKELKNTGDIKLYFPHFNNCYKNFKYLLNKYGKSREEIAEDVFGFINQDEILIKKAKEYDIQYDMNELYGYYSDYDHVVLCYLFGKMIDLPKGFPMYTIDLKQELDSRANYLINKVCYESGNHTVWDLNTALESIKNTIGYPKNNNVHNALSDAKWNFELYKFLEKIK